jgi:hypothetical protein
MLVLRSLRISRSYENPDSVFQGSAIYHGFANVLLCGYKEIWKNRFNQAGIYLQLEFEQYLLFGWLIWLV